MLSKKAFSLIELSIVVLIIGILIAGITQGSRVYNQAKLKTARTLTQSSPVASFKHLSGWWESTTLESFLTEYDDGDNISSWLDINPQNSSPYNTIVPGSNSPQYVESGINGLPSVDFNGNSALAVSDFNILGQTKSFTIFVVFKPDNIANRTSILSNGVDTSGQFMQVNFSFSIADTDGRLGIHNGSGFSLKSSTPQVVQDEAMIATFVNKYEGSFPLTSTFYKNGSSYTIGASNNATGEVLAQGGSYSTTTPLFIAGYNDGTWDGVAGSVTPGGMLNGQIGEIIIINKALNNSDREDVEKYLSQKWNISLN